MLCPNRMTSIPSQYPLNHHRDFTSDCFSSKCVKQSQVYRGAMDFLTPLTNFLWLMMLKGNVIIFFMLCANKLNLWGTLVCTWRFSTNNVQYKSSPRCACNKLKVSATFENHNYILEQQKCLQRSTDINYWKLFWHIIGAISL